MELTWLKTKVFFGKVWSFLKLYGGYILLGLGMLYTFYALRKKDEAVKNLLAESERVRKSHTDNLAQLQGQVEAEIQRRQQIQKQYDDLMATIQRDHDQGVQQIAATRDKEIREIIERNHKDPQSMATAVNQMFGIPIIQLQEVPK